jgi:hypothetical protein
VTGQQRVLTPHGTWSYLCIFQRSMLPYYWFCICPFDYDYVLEIIKGIRSILFLKNGLKKKMQKIKTYKNHLRSKNYVVYTAVAHSFPSILVVMLLENVSSDKVGRLLLWSNETELDFCHQSLIYAVNSLYFNPALILYVHWTLKCLFSMRKWHDLPFILCYELNSVQVDLLISKGDS